MSADNGYLLRKNNAGKFVLQMYWASADEFPPIEKGKEFDTVEAAIKYYDKIDSGDYPSEYGLTIRIRNVADSRGE